MKWYEYLVLGMLVVMVGGAIAAIIVLISTMSFAAPPPGTDLNSPTSKWFESLKQPGTGIGCCSISDCRPVDSDQDADGTFIAIIEKKQVKIPKDKVLLTRNPIGKAVACYTIYWDPPEVEHINILCFVPGFMI